MNGILYGINQNHLTALGHRHQIHAEALTDFKQLQMAAKEAGFEMSPFSSYRHFDAQASIWNRKARGERTLLDAKGLPLEYKQIPRENLPDTILQWSALPGLSRHHWGTDIDVVDEQAIPKDYQVDLTPQEVSDEGMFGPFHQWLDDQIENNQSFGFFRPYVDDLGGVKPERWHLSYYPLSKNYLEEIEISDLEKIIEGSDIELKDLILPRLEELIEVYARRVASPPWAN